jgi:hypothetical protein
MHLEGHGVKNYKATSNKVGKLYCVRSGNIVEVTAQKPPNSSRINYGTKQ